MKERLMSTMMSLPVSPAFKNNNLTITLQTSDYFAPYASVMVLSILEHASPDHNYDILVMTWDMQEETEQKFLTMANDRPNISIRVVNVSSNISKYDKIARKRKDYERFSATGIIRLMLPELLANYDTVLNLDCDMLVCADVSELFQYDLSNYYMGGVPDIICYVCNRRPEEKQFTDELLFKKLKLNKVSDYLNGGLLYLNLRKIREDFSTEEIMAFAQSAGTFFTCYEQDTFNGLFREKKLALPMEWNWIVDTYDLIRFQSQLLATSDYYIQKYNNVKKIKNIHYVGEMKPWKTAKCPKSNEWWATARKNPFFSQIINEGKSSDRFLFIAENEYQLLTCLSIKYHYYKDNPSDILISNPTNMEKYTESIRECGLFCDVFIQENISTKKLKHIPIKAKTIPLEWKRKLPVLKIYSTLFITDPESIYQKIVYHCIRRKDCPCDVYICDDGQIAYYINAMYRISKDIDYFCYPEYDQIHNNVKKIFLYEPQDCVYHIDIPFVIIPKVDEDVKFFHLAKRIFERKLIPDNKYIFIFSEDTDGKTISYNLKLLDMLSILVGKENIAVKLSHNINCSKRQYEFEGYKVFDDARPWLCYCFNSKLNEKVFISDTPTELITVTRLTHSKTPFLICLMDMIKFYTMWYSCRQDFRDYLHRITNRYNKEEPHFFQPTSSKGLAECIKYISGEEL